MKSVFKCFGSSILLVALLATLASCTSKDDDNQVYSYSPIGNRGEECGPSDSLEGGSSRVSGATRMFS